MGIKVRPDQPLPRQEPNEHGHGHGHAQLPSVQVDIGPPGFATGTDYTTTSISRVDEISGVCPEIVCMTLSHY